MYILGVFCQDRAWNDLGSRKQGSWALDQLMTLDGAVPKFFISLPNFSINKVRS